MLITYTNKEKTHTASQRGGYGSFNGKFKSLEYQPVSAFALSVRLNVIHLQNVSSDNEYGN